MSSLIEQALPQRNPGYLEALTEKLVGEGIVSPGDLLLTSKVALETKLSTHPSFNFMEMADTVTLRNFVDPDWKEGSDTASRSGGTAARPVRGSPERRQRSRSHDGSRARGRPRSYSDGGRLGARDNSRPHRNGYNRGGGPNRRFEPREPRETPEKPELWAAVEKGDAGLVEQLLANGSDPVERYQGWTPLMKAAEEGWVGIMQILIDRDVDIEACNRKGRTALSFAAAPSMKGEGEKRPTAVEAIRLLLRSGADRNCKCNLKKTPKDYAIQAKREDAIKVFEEF